MCDEVNWKKGKRKKKREHWVRLRRGGVVSVW